MGAGKYVAPDYTTQSGTVYPLGIDKTLAILRRLAAQFNPSAQDVPDMTVRVDAGTIYRGTTLTEVAAQNTVTITAPSVNPRIDRVVLDPANGVVTVIAGVESATPVPPAIISGFLPICQIALATSTTQIGDSLITDERQALMLFDDADADAFIETLADGATEEASPAVGDFALISDVSANDGRKSTLQSIFDLLANLTITLTSKTLPSPTITGTVPGGATYTGIVLTTPALGTPASGVLTNCTGLPKAGLAADVDFGLFPLGQLIASGNAVNFTGIPAGVDLIIVVSNGASSGTSTDHLIVQIGDSGGLETTGYVSVGGVYSPDALANRTDGFMILAVNAARAFTGHMFLTRIDGNTWISQHNGFSTTTLVNNGGGVKTLSGELDRLTIRWNGTATFDAGAFNVYYMVGQ
jgi:hypothetical protein